MLYRREAAAPRLVDGSLGPAGCTDGPPGRPYVVKAETRRQWPDVTDEHG